MAVKGISLHITIETGIPRLHREKRVWSLKTLNPSQARQYYRNYELIKYHIQAEEAKYSN